MHPVGQSADVVVAFDDRAGYGQRFDYVWIDSTLGQPSDIVKPAGLFFEYFNKIFTYDFALLLRILNALEGAEKPLGGFNANHVEAKVLIVRHHFVELIFAQQSVVDKYADKIAAYGFVQQNGCDLRIHPAGKRQYYAVVPQR